MDCVIKDNTLLDFSLNTLKKIPEPVNAQLYHTLILDENELQKIDNIQIYSNVQKLSLSKNRLVRMHEVGQLLLLQELNLSYNDILTIEGLDELKNLRHLNLAGNKLNAIENLNANMNLELINLSENNISIVSDLSFLKCLKKLYLHGNRLKNLRNCDQFLPKSLDTLTLAQNFINDLNEICTLSNLSNLENLTINENPCVHMKMFSNGFDHRPFVLNWCSSLKTIDNFAVSPIESLKAEWLYSQGRGRQFRLGEQESLSRYLSSVCPLLGKPREYENERKLRLILSKAQFHQKQLLEETSENSKQCKNHNAGKFKYFNNDSRRGRYFSVRQPSNYMANSFHGNPLHSSITGSNEALNSRTPFEMASSLRADLQRDSTKCRSLDSLDKASIEETTCIPSPIGPLAAATKMVPVPETLISPDICPQILQRPAESLLNKSHHLKNKVDASWILETNIDGKHCEQKPLIQDQGICLSPFDGQKKSSLHSFHLDKFNIKSIPLESINEYKKNRNKTIHERGTDEILSDEIKIVNKKATGWSQHQILKDEIVNSATPLWNLSALKIQKVWRGYISRKKNIKYVSKYVMKYRVQQYIRKLTNDMESTRVQLLNSHKVQKLEIQAINVLWNKISNLQNVHKDNSACCIFNNTTSITEDNSSAATISDLIKTCSLLASQVKRLQISISDMFDCISLVSSIITDNYRKQADVPSEKRTIGTQTDANEYNYLDISGNKSTVSRRPSTLSVENMGTSPSKLSP